MISGGKKEIKQKVQEIYQTINAKNPKILVSQRNTNKEELFKEAVCERLGRFTEHYVFWCLTILYF